jgi:hypothetical protein
MIPVAGRARPAVTVLSNLRCNFPLERTNFPIVIFGFAGDFHVLLLCLGRGI